MKKELQIVDVNFLNFVSVIELLTQKTCLIGDVSKRKNLEVKK